jgi:hypothetical protein
VFLYAFDLIELDGNDLRLMRSSRAHFLGFVEPTDAQAAEAAAAVRAFNLDAWQRKRLIVRERA